MKNVRRPNIKFILDPMKVIKTRKNIKNTMKQSPSLVITIVEMELPQPSLLISFFNTYAEKGSSSLNGITQARNLIDE